MQLRSISLSDKYNVNESSVFLTGIQALVRLCLLQKTIDIANGYNTAGFITGYRGSPLGAVDQQFLSAEKLLKNSSIIYEPAINEELAATAIWGAQQAEMRGDGVNDGVFCIWYGKGPGVDRSGDALKHGNLAGSSKYGGVLVLLGDDHTCESSTTCHQSEYALVDAMIPILNPANIEEIIEFGLHGWSLSRFSGVWCGLKCVKDNVESTMSINFNHKKIKTIVPKKFLLPPEGLNIRPFDNPHDQEARMHRYKLDAVISYSRQNNLDKVIFQGGNNPRFGIVSTGKSFMDTLQALEMLGIDERKANQMGLALYKVAMSWPLEPSGIKQFASKLDKVLVVEEKRGLIEDQLRAVLYELKTKPIIMGKKDNSGKVLFQVEGALNSLQVAVGIGKKLIFENVSKDLQKKIFQYEQILNAEKFEPPIKRKNYFCAGCPHNSSTIIPEGKRGYSGIGCHYMVQKMDRNIEGYTHMGAEGANWIGESKFSKLDHMFQNIGDGTYNHSGIMSIRAAVNSEVNITFKILFNDAVALTGGQMLEGDLNVYKIAQEVYSAGVKKIAIITDETSKYEMGKFPSSTTVLDRDKLQFIQNKFSSYKGVTVIIYDQTCAAEKRRRRKRGLMLDPPKRIFINEDVCEGCGDCGIQSNCVAIMPSETEYGTKRKIDQYSCNKDFSCVNGFCPSFVSIEGGELKKPVHDFSDINDIKEPIQKVSLDETYSILIAGVGGTGVVTLGALLGMAAHLEFKGCGVIDMTGLAQKGGAVVSHLKISSSPEKIKAIRISPGEADLLLGCDLVVSASSDILSTINREKSKILVNSFQLITGDFTRNPDFHLPANLIEHKLKSSVLDGSFYSINSSELAASLLGNSIGANLFILGVSYQLGLLPLESSSIEEAIKLNNVEVEFNLKAFLLGRAWVYRQENINNKLPKSKIRIDKTIEEIMNFHSLHLTNYQNEKYSKEFLVIMGKVKQSDFKKEKKLTKAVANSLAKLMTYKDEYEVARLYSNESFMKNISKVFSGNFKLKFYLAPPLISVRDKFSGQVKKRKFGSWVLILFHILNRMKVLRGTIFDIFSYTEERKTERLLISDYKELINQILVNINDENYELMVDLALMPMKIRGFGHVKKKNVENYFFEKNKTLKNVLDKRAKLTAA